MPVALPLVGVVVALVVILVFIAAWVFSELLARVFQNLPLVGGWVASNVRGLVVGIAGFIAKTWDWVTADVGWFFAAIAAWGWEHLYALSRALNHAIRTAIDAGQIAAGAAAAIGPAVAAGVNSAVQAADAYAHAQAAGAVGIAEGLYNQAVAHADAVGQTILGDAENLYNLAVAGTNALAGIVAADVAAIDRQLAGVEQALTGDVSELVAQMTADLNIAIATAEQAARAAEAAAISAAGVLSQTAAAGAVGALDQAAHDLVLGPWAALIPVIGPIAGVLDPAVAGALGLPGTLTEPVPVSIPGILSMVLPMVGAVAAEVDDCLVPNCRAVKNLGDLFNGLEHLGLAGLLFGLVAEAIADPEAAAGQITAAAGWTDPYAVELVNAVMG